MSKEVQGPNILWICTDQQRFDTLGCYGNEFVYTPNIDKLARMGVLFERCYCQNPVCAPSRGSFLTGRYPRTCRIRQNGQTIPADEKLITKILSDQGYVCGLSGKLHLSACHPSVCNTIEQRVDDGYVDFHWSHHPAPMGGENNWLMNEYTSWLKEKGVDYNVSPYKGCKYVMKGMASEYHQTTWCVEKAVNFIETAEVYGVPWLYSINIFDPHHPFDPPEDYLERYMDKLDDIPLPNYLEGELNNKPVFQRKDHRGGYDTPGNMDFTEMTDYHHKLIRAAYWAMIDHIDAQVGRVIDCLERTGQLENTIIVFTSDHGEMLGDHGIYLKGPYFYESAVHVPLIIAWPGTIEGGRRSKALVELVDLAPTLLEATSIEVYPGMQGKSLWGMLNGTASLDFHRDDVYCEYYNSNINHREPLAFATMLFDGRYKIVKVHGKADDVLSTGELYDLEDDNTETVNRWEDTKYSEVKMEMLEKLCDRMAMTCDPLPIRRAWW